MTTPTPLAQAVGDLDETTAVSLVEEKLAAGEAVLSILDELQAGMNVVGERFEGGDYYLSELIYAADIFKRAGAPLQEGLKNDIHDFGKDIVATVMSSNGLKVVDLGVNVEHQAFVDAIQIIKDAGLRDQGKILIGGGPVDEATREYVGADFYCKTAQDGVIAAKKILGVS